MDPKSNDTIIKIIGAQLGLTKFLIDAVLLKGTISYESLIKQLKSIQTVLDRVSENAEKMDVDCEYHIPESLSYLPYIFACPDKQELFYSADAETDIKRGCIGHMRGDFGKSGNEFHSLWFDHQAHLNTAVFKQEFDDLINTLKENLFLSRDVMRLICTLNPDSKNGDKYLFMCVTDAYEYYIGCFPEFGDYNFYIYCYDRKNNGG